MQFKTESKRKVEQTVSKTTSFSINTDGIKDVDLKRRLEKFLALDESTRWIKEHIGAIRKHVGIVEVYQSSRPVEAKLEISEGIGRYLTSEADAGHLAWSLLMELSEKICQGTKVDPYANGLRARPFSESDIDDSESNELQRFNENFGKDEEELKGGDAFENFNRSVEAKKKADAAERAKQPAAAPHRGSNYFLNRDAFGGR